MQIIIQGELTDLNTYINSERRNRFLAAKIKQDNTATVYYTALGLTPVVNYPVSINITWYTPNRRKDPDNIAFAKKFIMDGLVAAGILSNDTRAYISGFSDNFITDKKNPRIEVNITQKTIY